MLGDGIRNAWIKSARRKNQMTSAMAMDLIHSRIDCDAAFRCLVLPLTA